jgi:hypothetical protein
MRFDISKISLQHDLSLSQNSNNQTLDPKFVSLTYIIGFNPFYAELLYPGKYKLFVCLSVSDTYMCVKIDTSLLYTLFYKKNQLLILCMAEHNQLLILCMAEH